MRQPTSVRRLLALLLPAVLAVVAGCGTSSVDAKVGGTDTPAHECDTVAAHPADLDRMSKGVPDADLAPALAVQQCTEAVRKNPETARFWFQLGRAHWMRGAVEQSQQAFDKASNLGHCGARFYLGEIHLRRYAESAAEADGEASSIFYEQAAACDFEPARTRLAELTFNAEGFRRPLIVTALYDGNIEELNRQRIFVAQYLLGIHGFISLDYHPKDSWCPANISQPDVVYRLEGAAVGDAETFLDRGAMDLVLAGMRKFGALIDPVWKGDPDKYREILLDLGKKDGQLMAERFGCSSGVLARIYGNLVEFSHSKYHIVNYYENLFDTENAGFSEETKTILFGQSPTGGE